MASDEEIKNIFKQFSEANSRLSEAINLEEESDIKRDAVIKRFEFNYELLWKTFKHIARYEKMECFSPKGCFKIAFKMGLIGDEALFLELIDARNRTSHMYSEDESRRIYGFIKEKAVKCFLQAKENIEIWMKNK